MSVALVGVPMMQLSVIQLHRVARWWGLPYLIASRHPTIRLKPLLWLRFSIVAHDKWKSLKIEEETKDLDNLA